MKAFLNKDNNEFQYKKSSINKEINEEVREKEKEKIKKDTSLFCTYLTKISAIDLIGIATLLKVELYHKTYTKDPKKALARSGEDVIKDCIIHFNAAARSSRRQILKLCKAAIKDKG